MIRFRNTTTRYLNQTPHHPLAKHIKRIRISYIYTFIRVYSWCIGTCWMAWFQRYHVFEIPNPDKHTESGNAFGPLKQHHIYIAVIEQKKNRQHVHSKRKPEPTTPNTHTYTNHTHCTTKVQWKNQMKLHARNETKRANTPWGGTAPHRRRSIARINNVRDEHTTDLAAKINSSNHRETWLWSTESALTLWSYDSNDDNSDDDDDEDDNVGAVVNPPHVHWIDLYLHIYYILYNNPPVLVFSWCPCTQQCSFDLYLHAARF